MSNRYSLFSTASAGATAGPRTSVHQASQVSTTTLLNALHTYYSTSQPYALESGTSLVVNTWLNTATTTPDGLPSGVVDSELARRAWEHARRRAEDGCIVLG
jgi:chitin synthase